MPEAIRNLMLRNLEFDPFGNWGFDPFGNLMPEAIRNS